MTRKRCTSPPMPALGSAYVGIYDDGVLAEDLRTLDGAPYASVQFVDPDELKIGPFLSPEDPGAMTYRRVPGPLGGTPSGSAVDLLVEDVVPPVSPEHDTDKATYVALADVGTTVETPAAAQTKADAAQAAAVTTATGAAVALSLVLGG